MNEVARTITGWMTDLDFWGLWLPGMMFVILEVVILSILSCSTGVVAMVSKPVFIIPFLVVSYVAGCVFQALTLWSGGHFKKHFNKLYDKLQIRCLDRFFKRDESSRFVPQFSNAKEFRLHNNLRERLLPSLSAEEDSKEVTNLYEAYLQQVSPAAYQRSMHLMSIASLDNQMKSVFTVCIGFSILQFLVFGDGSVLRNGLGLTQDILLNSFWEIFTLDFLLLIGSRLLKARSTWFYRYRVRYIYRQIYILRSEESH